MRLVSLASTPCKHSYNFLFQFLFVIKVRLVYCYYAVALALHAPSDLLYIYKSYAIFLCWLCTFWLSPSITKIIYYQKGSSEQLVHAVLYTVCTVCNTMWFMWLVNIVHTSKKRNYWIWYRVREIFMRFFRVSFGWHYIWSNVV